MKHNVKVSKNYIECCFYPQDNSSIAMDHDTNHSDVSESDNGQDCSTGGTGAINLSAVRPASAPTSENAPNSRNTSKTSSSLTCTTSSSRVNGDNTDSSDRQVSTTLCQNILIYGELLHLSIIIQHYLDILFIRFFCIFIRS